MLFSNSLRVLPNHIRINDYDLCQVDTRKFLGLHIDKELTWKTHMALVNIVVDRLKEIRTVLADLV